MANEIEIVEKNALAEINDRFNKLEKIKKILKKQNGLLMMLINVLLLLVKRRLE